MLLIITSEKDLAADYLIIRLIEKELPYFRINFEQLSSSAYFFEISDTKTSRRVVLDGRRADLADVRAVWYRRAIQPPPPPELSQSQRAFVAGELRHFWTGLLIDPAPIWVNPIDRVFAAEHKLLQLQIAQRIGLRVPNSIISSNVKDLRAFVLNVGSAICKPIYHGLYLEGNDRYSIYTRRVNAADDFEDLTGCPIFLQKEISRRCDLRATFIGDTCFTASITSADPLLVDWRAPGVPLRYETAKLPAAIESKCREMLSQLGLRYGAFDFVVDKSGEPIFLEVNPTGEWAWLEDRLDLPMRDAFIQLFYGDQT